MLEYLSYIFIDSEECVSTIDELPLWSAPFGLLMLKHLELKPNLTVIDIGSGQGFPLMELAERLGKTSKLYGIDTWQNANKRAIQKIKDYGLSNVDIIEASGNNLPFEDNTIDLAVSNLGINNFENPHVVFDECFRVLKPNGKLVITTNLNGHWKEFYNVFEDVLKKLRKNDIVEKLTIQQQNRGSIGSISKLYTGSGFTINNCVEDSFEMKFVDGSAFLNHHFVKLGWLSSWTELVPENERSKIFSLLEEDLNNYSEKQGGLKLTIPMAYIEGSK